MSLALTNDDNDCVSDSCVEGSGGESNTGPELNLESEAGGRQQTRAAMKRLTAPENSPD